MQLYYSTVDECDRNGVGKADAADQSFVEHLWRVLGHCHIHWWSVDFGLQVLVLAVALYVSR